MEHIHSGSPAFFMELSPSVFPVVEMGNSQGLKTKRVDMHLTSEERRSRER